MESTLGGLLIVAFLTILASHSVSCRDIRATTSERTVKCGKEARNNNTYFQNPNYPSPEGTKASDCPIMVHTKPDICQIRLDFETFSLPAPNNDGVCDQASFTVSLPKNSPTMKMPLLCGEFNNQHMYVNVEDNQHIWLEFTGVGPQTWRIRIQMIECNSLVRAPDGCQQYYYGNSGSGQVEILGYNPNRLPHLSNLHYTLCVRREVGKNSITWEVCNSNSFSMSEDATMSPQAAQDNVCADDYIQMWGRTMDDSHGMSDHVFCGTALNTNSFGQTNMPITSVAKPFLIHVVTNGDEVGDMNNVGFCLTYRQD